MSNNQNGPFGPPPGGGWGTSGTVPPSDQGQAPPPQQQQGYGPPPQQQGYGPPQQQGYPPPPQQQYPMQPHQGYPPQQGYPMQPQQGYPMQPQQGYPMQPQGYPPQGYPGHGPINIVVQNTATAGGGSGIVRIGNKSRMSAALLAFFLGGLGAHKFYLGRTAFGVLYLLMFWTFIPAGIAFIEGILFLMMSDHDFDLRYNSALTR